MFQLCISRSLFSGRLFRHICGALVGALDSIERTWVQIHSVLSFQTMDTFLHSTLLQFKYTTFYGQVLVIQRYDEYLECGEHSFKNTLCIISNVIEYV